MEITPIGFAGIALALFGFLLRPRLLFYAGVFFVPFSATTVVNLTAASFGLTLSIFFFFAFALAQLMQGGKDLRAGIAPAQLVPVAALVCLLAAIVASLVPAVLENRLEPVSVRMSVYVSANAAILMLVVLTVDRPERLTAVLRVQAASMLCVALWGLFQFVCSQTGLEYPGWIFNTSVSDASQFFGVETDEGYVRIGSAAVEPSILVQSLAWQLAALGTLLVTGSRRAGRLAPWAAAAASICIVLSTSTTGYVLLGVLAALLFLERPGRFLVMALGVLLAGAVLVAVEPRLLNAIVENTVDKGSSWSFSDRTETVIIGVQTFMEHPLLGAGWASVRSYSVAVFYLANSGLVGMAAYAGLVLTLFAALTLRGRSAADGEEGLVCRGLRNALIVSLSGQLVAGSTHVFGDFWVLCGLCVAAIGMVQPAERPKRPAAQRVEGTV